MQKKIGKLLFNSFLVLSTPLIVGSFAWTLNQHYSSKSSINLISHQPNNLTKINLSKVSPLNKTNQAFLSTNNYEALLIKLNAQKLSNSLINHHQQNNEILKCTTNNESVVDFDWDQNENERPTTPQEVPTETKSQKVWSIVGIVLVAIAGIGFIVGIITYKFRKNKPR